MSRESQGVAKIQQLLVVTKDLGNLEDHVDQEKKENKLNQSPDNRKGIKQLKTQN